MINSKLRLSSLLAVAALASASGPFIPLPTQSRGKRRPQATTYYGGLTKEQQAWNAAVDAKRKAKKDPS